VPKKPIQNQIVKESNAVARAKIKPKTDSVWEERIISILLAKVRTNDKIFHKQAISFEELNAGREMSSLEHREAVKAVENLLSKVYIIPYSNRGIEGWPIFKHIKIDDDGNIEAQINSDLCEHFLDLRKQFALRSLPEFRQLSGTYAQQLFRYLNSWKNTHVETTVKLDELHEFLSTPLSMKKDFKEFRLKVLERAHKEITEKTNLCYEWEPVKQGLRKVIAVRFIFDTARAAAAEAERQATQGKAKVLKTIGELQHLSMQCWERLQGLKKKCKPKKSPKCEYCTTRGKMAAIKYLEENQGKLPFDEVIDVRSGQTHKEG
jgi:plasmid replication initiation protein